MPPLLVVAVALCGVLPPWARQAAALSRPWTPTAAEQPTPADAACPRTIRDEGPLPAAGADHLQVVVAVTQPLNFTIDAKEDLRRAVAKMTSDLGFRQQAFPAVPQGLPKPPAAPREPVPDEGPRVGDAIGRYTATGTIPCSAVQRVVDQAKVPAGLLTRRVRDLVIVRRLRTYARVEVVEVDRRRAPRIGHLSLALFRARDERIPAFARDVRAHLECEKIMVFGIAQNPGQRHCQLSVEIDAEQCRNVAARLKQTLAAQIREWSCT